MFKFFALLWQPIRPFEFTAPVFDRLKYRLLAIKPVSTLIFALPDWRRRLTKRIVNERIVEVPCVLGQLPQSPVQVLDVGACESSLALMLASLGHRVTAVDLRPYPFAHPNLTIKVGDVTRLRLRGRFDIVICLSTLEHIGLGVYGDKALPDGDAKAVAKMYHLLKPGGYLLLTVPLTNRFRVRPMWREYDLPTLKRLLRPFRSWTVVAGIKNGQQHWQLYSDLPANEAVEGELVGAVALVKAWR